MVTVENGKVIAELTFDSIQQMKSVMISLTNRFEFVEIDAVELKLWIILGDA